MAAESIGGGLSGARRDALLTGCREVARASSLSPCGRGLGEGRPCAVSGPCAAPSSRCRATCVRIYVVRVTSGRRLLSLVRPREKSPKRRPPRCRALCAFPALPARPRRLWNSHDAPKGAHVLKQSSPTSPRSSELLGAILGPQLRKTTVQCRAHCTRVRNSAWRRFSSGSRPRIDEIGR